MWKLLMVFHLMENVHKRNVIIKGRIPDLCHNPFQAQTSFVIIADIVCLDVRTINGCKKAESKKKTRTEIKQNIKKRSRRKVGKKFFTLVK